MPDLSATDVLSQAYQGMANTVGPYFNISSIFQPAYGQTALGNQQQQMFGYNVGPGGSIGTPYSPYGGWVGGPQPTQASPYGAPAPAYGPAAPAGQPGATPTGMTLGGAAQRRLVARQFQAHLAARKSIRRHKIRGSVLVRRSIIHTPVNSVQRKILAIIPALSA